MSYEVKETRHGRLAFDNEDTFVGRALKDLGEYSWEEAERVVNLLSRDSVVVEAGAHIGTMTLPMARKCRQVFAFEPQRLPFQMLCANLVLNEIQNVWARQDAIGAADGHCLVPHSTVGGARNTGGIALKGVTAGEPCLVRSIDSLGFPHVDLIKADIEEMELDLIRGAGETIRRDRPALYLESNVGTDQLLAQLDDLGYLAYWHFPPIFIEERAGVPKLVISFNLLCLHRDSEQVPAVGLARARLGDVGMDVANRMRMAA